MKRGGTPQDSSVVEVSKPTSRVSHSPHRDPRSESSSPRWKPRTRSPSPRCNSRRGTPLLRWNPRSDSPSPRRRSRSPYYRDLRRDWSPYHEIFVILYGSTGSKLKVELSAYNMIMKRWVPF